MPESTTSDFLDLELDAEIRLGEENVPLGRLMALKPGSVFDLLHRPDDPVELVVNDRVVARGELVVLDGRFGFRVAQTAQQILANPDPGRSAATADPSIAADPAADRPVGAPPAAAPAPTGGAPEPATPDPADAGAAVPDPTPPEDGGGT